MLCENCKQQDASVHITEINHATSQRMQRHFCPSCAELFQQSDIVQRMLGRLPMIKLRVAAVSAQRTVLNVLGGAARWRGLELCLSHKALPLQS